MKQGRIIFKIKVQNHIEWTIKCILPHLLHEKKEKVKHVTKTSGPKTVFPPHFGQPATTEEPTRPNWFSILVDKEQLIWYYLLF